VFFRAAHEISSYTSSDRIMLSELSGSKKPSCGSMNLGFRDACASG